MTGEMAKPHQTRSELAAEASGACGLDLVFRPAYPRWPRYLGGYCGYLERSTGPTSRLQIPSASVGLIVGFGPPMHIAHGNAGNPARATSFVAGLHDSPVTVTSSGWQHGLQIDLTPVGARMLFGVPMHLLANRAVDLDDLLGVDAGLLAERLYQLPTWRARFALVDALLSRRLSVAEPVSPALAWAWRRLCGTSSRLRIGDLADEIGYSRQQLLSAFRDVVGLAPKTMARILRFQRAVAAIEVTGRSEFSAIALDAGYYDQAHFNRDFLELAGTTPTDYLARRLPGGAGVGGAG